MEIPEGSDGNNDKGIDWIWIVVGFVAVISIIAIITSFVVKRSVNRIDHEEPDANVDDEDDPNDE